MAHQNPNLITKIEKSKKKYLISFLSSDDENQDKNGETISEKCLIESGSFISASDEELISDSNEDEKNAKNDNNLNECIITECKTQTIDNECGKIHTDLPACNSSFDFLKGSTGNFLNSYSEEEQDMFDIQ